MGDSRSDLPEGTDSIITGASNPDETPGGARAGATASSAAGSTGGGDETVVISETTLVTETEVPTGGGLERTPARTGGPQADAGRGDASGTVIQKIRSGGEKISGQAADKARDLVTQGLERSAEALANVGRLVGDTATGLDERLGPDYGEYARRAASAIENTANSIASKDPEELIEDTRNFVRKSPAVALAGAAIVGFAVARLLKSGLSSTRDRNEAEDDDR